MSLEFPPARWSISLDCDCPSCQENVDLTLATEFWYRSPTGTPLQPAQTGALDVICPECGHEFICEMEY